MCERQPELIFIIPVHFTTYTIHVIYVIILYLFRFQMIIWLPGMVVLAEGLVFTVSQLSPFISSITSKQCPARHCGIIRQLQYHPVSLCSPRLVLFFFQHPNRPMPQVRHSSGRSVPQRFRRRHVRRCRFRRLKIPLSSVLLPVVCQAH